MSSSLSLEASRRLIQSDLRFSMAVLKAIAANQDRDATTSWLALSHLHFLSLVAYEVRNFTQRLSTAPVPAQPWAYDLALAASRHSTKLFNDRKKSQLDLLAEFVNGAAKDRGWFLANNRAPWLFRWLPQLGFLVNDTSVLLYDGRAMCTSHSIRFHAGLDPRAGQAETEERACELAAYLSELAGAEGQDRSDDDYFRGWCSQRVVLKDARYEKLYPAMFPSVPSAEAIALGILQSDLAVLQLIRELVPDSDPLAPATFKFRFAGLWQIIESLRAILAPGGDLILSDSMRSELAALLYGDLLEPMTTSGARSLRNVLVHYGLGSIDATDLNWHDPILGLPELLLDGTNWLVADQRVAEHVIALLDMFARWAGPFDHTLKEPHE